MSLPNKRQKVGLHDVISRGFLTEKNVGVTEFIGKQRAFVGVLKHRFEDFLVHEIDKSGKVVRIENIEQPEDIVYEEKKKEPVINLEEIKLDPETVEKIKSYAENHGKEKETPLIEIEELTKEERTKIHAFIRQNFVALDSTTETIDGKRHIRVVAGKQSGARNQRNQRHLQWPKDKGDYAHFVLYKENLETVQVVNELSRRLGCNPKNFTFAGTKDKRAITTQMFCVYRTSPRKIWNAVQEFNRRSRFAIKIHVGHFEFHSGPLRLGDLKGNRFDVVLRDLRLVDDLERGESDPAEIKTNVEDALSTLQKVGFINYFGMQRFGSHRIDSHKLGILILRRDFKQLVYEILSEKPIDMRPHNRQREVSFNEAIRLWRETGDAQLAYKKMNYKYTIEGSLLRALSKVGPNDYHGALCIGMVRNSRLLYLHAYQSFLWNRIASFRIREYGLSVVQGDLVLVGSEDIPLEGEVSQEEPDKAGDSQSFKANISSEQIVLVTADNIDQFTIYDVVLPIIGGLSKLPQNRTAEFINQILKEDNVTIADFAALSKQWCVNGSYRKLVIRPDNLKWQWKHYQDSTIPLIQSDLEKIEQTNGGDVTIPEVTSGPNSKVALLLSVTLPTSCYATVMLRELTKLSSLSLENKPWQSLLTEDDLDQESESGCAESEP